MERFGHLGRDPSRQHGSARNSRPHNASPDRISNGSVNLRAAFDSSFMNEPVGQTTTDAFGKAMISDFEPKRPRSTSSVVDINAKRVSQLKDGMDDTHRSHLPINGGALSKINTASHSAETAPLFIDENLPRPNSLDLDSGRSPSSEDVPRPSPLTDEMRLSTPHHRDVASQVAPSPSTSIASSFDAPPRTHSPEVVIEPRLPERREPEAPLIYDVPLAEMPTIDWCPVDMATLGKPMDELEYSETESEYESDAGSIIEMLDDSSDSDFGDEEDTLYVPEKPEEDGLLGDDDDDDDDDDYVDDDISTEATKVSDLEIVEAYKADSKEPKHKRPRIPTLKWWNGERIEYRLEGTLQLPSAVSIRTVEEPQKQYRKRRTRRPRNNYAYEEGDIHAEVYDGNAEKWYDRTIAKSVSGLEFHEIYNSEGEPIPLVTQCVAFSDAGQSPMRCYVLKIEPNGVYHSPAEDSKETTFFVWKGSCSASVNNNEFEISPGKACLAPKGNDLLICNNALNEVLLFVTEVADADMAESAASDAQNLPSQITNSVGPIAHDEQGSDGDTARADEGGPVASDEGYNGSPDEGDMVGEYQGDFLNGDNETDGSGLNLQGENTTERNDNHATGHTFERYMDSMVPRTKAITEHNPESDSLAAALFSDSPPLTPLRGSRRNIRRRALNLRTIFSSQEDKNSRGEINPLRQLADLDDHNGHQNLDSFLDLASEEQYSIASPRLLPSILKDHSTEHEQAPNEVHLNRPPPHSPAYSPARLPIWSPARSPARSPIRSTVTSPIRTHRAPLRSPMRSPDRIYNHNRPAWNPPASAPLRNHTPHPGRFSRIISAPVVGTYDPQSPLSEFSGVPNSVKLDLPPPNIPTQEPTVEDNGIHEFLRGL